MISSETCQLRNKIQDIVDRKQKNQQTSANILEKHAPGSIPPMTGLPGDSDQRSRPDVQMENNAEIIIPLQAFKKDARSAGSDLKRTYLLKMAILGMVLGSMLLGGVGLWHYLAKNPLRVADPAPQGLPTASGAEPKRLDPVNEPPETLLDPARLALDKKNAEQKLAEFIEAKGALERQGVSEWGGQLFTDMTRLGQEADSFFMQKDFVSAAEIYAQAAVAAKELTARTGDVFNHFLEEGQMALADGNGTLAQKKFAVALMIDSFNPVAQRGLQRSKTIEAVMQLVASGRQHEKNNDLSVALTDYQEALRIDPYSEEARQALIRVEGRIDTQHYKQLMSEGLAAFHSNDLQNARIKLQKSKTIKPDSRETLDALAQVDQAIRLSRIEVLRQDAQVAEQNEDWETALRAYSAVLELDQNLQLAARGKERALEQIRLKKRIEFFLTKPEALQSDTQLNNAILLLAEAGETELKGPRLGAQLKELERLVDLAQIPVKITIESDNLTEISIYRVGKLGKLTTHELNLRPGTYTVVGARDGYQDIRQELVIKSGQESVSITVACRVKI
jgi:hypothetical protein